MAVLSTILVILGAWCAASAATAALYAALRRSHVRRQRAAAAVPDAVGTARDVAPGARTGRPCRSTGPGRTVRPARPSGRTGRSGWGRGMPPPDLQAG